MGLSDRAMALFQRVWGSFLGRCVQRFIAMTGIDRCLMLSSQAFTALIPLLILMSALAPADQEDVISGAVITRFGLEGDNADAVEQLFDIPEGATGSLSVFSILLLLASGTSFARRLAKTYRAAWEQDKAGVRSGLYSALGLLVLLCEVLVLYFARSLVRKLPLSWVFSVPLSVATGLVLWTSIPWLLLDRRVHWRRLVFGGAVAALASSIYSVATTIYMPDLVERYTTEFGLFGITIAIIGWLLATAGILVASAAIGAEFDRSEEPWARWIKDRYGLRDPLVPPAVGEAAPLRLRDREDPPDV